MLNFITFMKKPSPKRGTSKRASRARTLRQNRVELARATVRTKGFVFNRRKARFFKETIRRNPPHLGQEANDLIMEGMKRAYLGGQPIESLDQFSQGEVDRQTGELKLWPHELIESKVVALVQKLRRQKQRNESAISECVWLLDFCKLKRIATGTTQKSRDEIMFETIKKRLTIEYGLVAYAILPVLENALKRDADRIS